MNPSNIPKSTVIIAVQLFILFLLTGSLCIKSREAASEDYFLAREDSESGSGETGEADYIRWVDFTVPADVLKKAFRLDVETCQADIHLNWIDLLAWLAAKYGGDFSRFSDADLNSLAEKLKSGASMEKLAADLPYYTYYKEAYTAVLGGMVGYFDEEIDASAQNPAAGTSPAVGDDGSQTAQEKTWVTKYGLKAFSPIARDFPYSDYDDFGTSRSYGYTRKHLGHDMMGQVGTPVIAVESGTVEALGWNQYGGWRLGIRSFDHKRYYYYAHLRKNYPYQSGLEVGSVVQAGDVIGYLGRTGYSRTENTNNIDDPHLHFGLELIFDEPQKASNNEIWVSCYELVKFLNLNRCEAVKVEGTKEWKRLYGIKDPLVPVQPATPSQAGPAAESQAESQAGPQTDPQAGSQAES